MAMSTLSLLLNALYGSYCHWKVLHAQKMKWLRFSLNCLVGPAGNYIQYQIERTIAGLCSGNKGVKLWDNVRANFRPFNIVVCSCNYNYSIKTCKMLFGGYFCSVWWYFSTWGATWDPWSCLTKNIKVLCEIVHW